MRDGQYLFELAGYAVLYGAERVREMMAGQIAAFADVQEAPPLPEHQH